MSDVHEYSYPEGYEERECDVLIIGNSLAGGTLALQLSRQQPDLKICVVEKKEDFDYWVGESTLPLWTDYATRILGLGPYLWKHHMLKHGLRFFFDNEEKNLPLHRLSEIGRRAYPGVVAFQLDRATFDRHILKLNRERGVEVLMKTRVMHRTRPPDFDITIDGENGHVVQTTRGPIKCRYLVDAAGAGSPLARMFDLLIEKERHAVGSYWGRFRTKVPMDELGPESWRARVGHTNRMLSTNHFMYKGYWIWMIPVTDDIFSIGVTFHPDMVPIKIKNASELEAWLRTHKCMDEILGTDAEALDFMGLRHLRRRAKQFYSSDRWFLTGMSGAVVDPLFSLTCAVTSWSNRFVGQLIATDRSGDKQAFAAQLKHFNIEMQNLSEAWVQRMDYRAHGSMDAFAGARQAGMSISYNRGVPAGYKDLGPRLKMIAEHGTSCSCTEDNVNSDIEKSLHGQIFRMRTEFVDFLEETGRYYELNEGHFLEASPRSSLQAKMWAEGVTNDEYAVEDRITYEAMVRHFLSRMAEIKGVDWNEPWFHETFVPDWGLRHTLAALFEGLVAANAKKPPTAEEKINDWHPVGPNTPFDVGWVGPRQLPRKSPWDEARRKR